MTRPESSKQLTVLGLVLGLALALAFDSILVSLFGIAGLVFFFPHLLIAIVFGLSMGVVAARTKLIPRKSWRAIFIVAILLLPIATCGPIGLVKWRLYRLASVAIPVPAQMKRTLVVTDWLGNETYGQQTTFRFLTKLERSDLWDFYRVELRLRGWRETSYVNDGIGGSFERNRGEVIQLWIGAADAEGRNVEITYSR